MQRIEGEEERGRGAIAVRFYCCCVADAPQVPRPKLRETRICPTAKENTTTTHTERHQTEPKPWTVAITIAGTAQACPC